jgi:hypothetical protein
VSPNNLAQPSTSFWQWTVQATTQLSLYLLQLNPHTPGNSLSHNFKPAIFYGTTAVVSETKKIEGFWFALAVFGTAFLGKRSTNPFFFIPPPMLCCAELFQGGAYGAEQAIRQRCKTQLLG